MSPKASLPPAATENNNEYDDQRNEYSKNYRGDILCPNVWGGGLLYLCWVCSCPAAWARADHNLPLEDDPVPDVSEVVLCRPQPRSPSELHIPAPGPHTRDLTVPRLTELDSEGGPAGHVHVALAGQAGRHLGDEEEGHRDQRLGEPGAGQVQQTLLAPAERHGVVLLPHTEVTVQVIAGVLQHRALGGAVKLVILDPKPGHERLSLLPGLDDGPGPVSVGPAIESDELPNWRWTLALAVQGQQDWNLTRWQRQV